MHNRNLIKSGHGIPSAIGPLRPRWRWLLVIEIAVSRWARSSSVSHALLVCNRSLGYGRIGRRLRQVDSSIRPTNQIGCFRRKRTSLPHRYRSIRAREVRPGPRSWPHSKQSATEMRARGRWRNRLIGCESCFAVTGALFPGGSRVALHVRELTRSGGYRHPGAFGRRERGQRPLTATPPILSNPIPPKNVSGEKEKVQ